MKNKFKIKYKYNEHKKSIDVTYKLDDLVVTHKNINELPIKSNIFSYGEVDFFHCITIDKVMYDINIYSVDGTNELRISFCELNSDYHWFGTLNVYSGFGRSINLKKHLEKSK